MVFPGISPFKVDHGTGHTFRSHRIGAPTPQAGTPRGGALPLWPSPGGPHSDPSGPPNLEGGGGRGVHRGHSAAYHLPPATRDTPRPGTPEHPAFSDSVG